MKLNALNIVDMRNRHGWSQEDLAAAAGLSTRTIQRVETEGNGSLDSAKAIAAAFDVSLEKVRNPELQWRHLKLIWRPLAEWFFYSIAITILTATTVKYGWISDPTGENFVISMMLMLLLLTGAKIGLRFYDEFGPYWKQWDL